ncbi:MAG TPA: ABC transporter permease [Terriglobales bacterium]|nr:ABC transporter permease [Terriglobales bacterium]
MFWQELRFGMRRLAKAPAFTIVAVLTLALGIAANTAIFSVINGLFFHPAGVSDPGRLLAIRVRYDKLNLKSIEVSLPDFVNVRDSKQIFSSAAVVIAADYNYVGNGMPERLLGANVSWQWFQTFGVRPLLGRDFRPEEDQPGANHEVILSYETWQRVFGGDPAIVNQSIQLNSQAYKVVGVMAEGFDWPDRAQIWVPMGLAPAKYSPENRFNEAYFAVARVKPGVAVEQAEAFVKVLAQQSVEPGQAAAYAKDAQWGMFGLPLIEFIYGDLRTPMLVLLGAVGFVLLITCANVAGLMLARASGRAKELAIRSALGARTSHLVRQTMADSLLMSAGGSVLGLGLAFGAVNALRGLAPDSTIRNAAIPMDVNVLLFTLGVAVLAAILFGVAPAWQLSRAADFEFLQEGGRSNSGGRRRQRLRSALVVSEVGLALVLLVGAGLFLRSLQRMQEVNPGFEPLGLMSAQVSLSPAAYKDQGRQIAFFQQVTDRLARAPGVQNAAAVDGLPFSDSGDASSFEIEGRPVTPGDPGPHSNIERVTPGYFSTMHIPFLTGRDFSRLDRQGSPVVVIIDANLARQYWPSQNPVGQRIRYNSLSTGSTWATIVGVVAHCKRSALVGESDKGMRYYSLLQTGASGGFLVARTSADPAALASTLRQTVKDVEPSQAATYDLQSMEQRVADSLGPRRFAVTLLSVFAGMALFLAALGLYGVISYSVALRTQEIGIRMALGARRLEVLRMVVGQGMRLVAAGISVGLVVAFAFAEALSSQLFEVSAFDPVTLLAMVLVMAAVAVLASYIPARRAANVDPIVALRYE